MEYETEIPLKTISEANTFEHWSISHRRHKNQKYVIWYELVNDKPDVKLPCTVTFTRIAPRALDGDNLQVAFKYIRDQVAEYITGSTGGHGDADPRITWLYQQQKRKPKEYAIKIKISS